MRAIHPAAARVVFLICVLLAFTAGLGSLRTSAASAAEPARLEVTAAAPRLDAAVSWSLEGQVDGAIAGYEVEVGDVYTTAVHVLTEVGAGTASLTASGLPLAEWQVAVVRALDADGLTLAVGRSAPFRVLATLSVVDPSPFVKHGDGDCCETYWTHKKLELDAPMPVDVWLRPIVLDFDGNEAHDGFDQTDPLWPGAVNDEAIRIPAGETTARFQILWWGDEWKRFEYAHTTWGFEVWQHPTGGSGYVRTEEAVQEVTFHETDPDFWPEVHVTPLTDVDGGDVARVKVSLDERPARSTVLRYQFRDGTARAGRDYTRTSGRLVLRPGQRVAWLRIPTSELRGARQRTFSVRVTKAEKRLASIVGRQQCTVRIRG